MAAPLTLLADTAADLMTAGPVSIHGSATVNEAAAFFASRGFGAAAVLDAAGRPVGVVTKSDLLIHACGLAEGVEHVRTPVDSVMTPTVFSVRPDTPAASVVAQLVALSVKHLFVVDAAGVLVGVITPADVIRKLG
ncbi:CBS domain-containing protein [Urbifossiella limnaea]|uniref:Magnesium transporter MgtE n=1 Tax=Urbifossiella limnaea TaxID=2528023 RepID=A0A517XS91_9BACT|nr:CBS domain-containing protein [Urbifossiella limnaea]QDU20353.1 Magnesium transporter MgtE [Urbifossiella limnaea]